MLGDGINVIVTGTVNFNTAVPVDGSPPYTEDYFVDPDGYLTFEREAYRIDGNEWNNAGWSFDQVFGLTIADFGVHKVYGTDSGVNIIGSPSQETYFLGDGNDTVDGGVGPGADTIYGGGGNDTYIIKTPTIVSEHKLVPPAGGGLPEIPTDEDAGGIDLVKSSISFGLPEFFENLTLTGTAALHGSGNNLANVIHGNSAGNVLRGMAGNDNIFGNGGADSLFGNGGNDSLKGGAGNDLLVGGDGKDTLTGEGGADTFYLSRALGTTDKIVDFSRDEGDHLRLRGSEYGLHAGSLDPSRLSTTGVVTSPSGTGQFVYNPSSDTLFWDADGAGGSTGLAIATFSFTPQASDFIVV